MARMIDADELTKVIENLLYEPDSVQYVWSSDVLSAIRSAPTVQPAPVVHGRWVKVPGFATPGGDPVWRCSECGKGQHVYGIEHGSYGVDVSDGQWVTCPNCGAKMDGEEA